MRIVDKLFVELESARTKVEKVQLAEKILHHTCSRIHLEGLPIDVVCQVLDAMSIEFAKLKAALEVRK